MDQLPGILTKVAANLAVKPEHFITHPAELKILHGLDDRQLDDLARERGWRVVRRVGGRQIEFYNDVTIRPNESGRA